MKPILIAAAALALATAASAQQDGEKGAARSTPASGMGSKTMQSCKADIAKHCAGASSTMQKECLVKNWDRISNDCQDAVGTPGRGRAGAAE